MISSFASLDMMRRALSAQQLAISTTGNNISNANTEGYSRQRVNLTESNAFPSPGANAPHIPGQIGTGVDATTVQRIRDSFADDQYRAQANSNGYWSAKSDSLSQMEDVVNEPSDTGLSTVLNNFWNSLQDLASNPGNDGPKSVVLQNGKTVADTFNYLSHSLTDIQGNLKEQIDVSTDTINSIASQINDINREIGKLEPNGLVANDLYDQRDNLVDQLSQLVNVKVTRVESGGNASPVAEGKYTIEITDKSGQGFTPPATLVDGSHLTFNEMSTTYGGTAANPTVTVSLNGQTLPGDQMNGKLQGLIDSYSKDYPEMLTNLDQMAKTFGDAFNAVYKGCAGYDASVGNFFSDTSSAENFKVNDKLTKANISAGAVGGAADDNSIAQKLSDVLKTDKHDFEGNGQETTLTSYLQGIIGDMGVDAQQANRMTNNTASLMQTASNNRQSVSGVSIDEEMVNLIQYQHSYSAAARVMTTLDEMLDTLINRMGV
ncbi:flagellar hook-associated protein FlgK [Terrilactibacillus laevilacticus]|uniref:Flagellar hook-associated protein 1 n=1 Tax=Terrilactibacillus laevilacticus TaxID=1380157 RepID=A0ABW5PKP2_9BACI|nr:flagellar hook-associated protein FlgK [Terrilactibacillus laevilacticus]